MKQSQATVRIKAAAFTMALALAAGRAYAQGETCTTATFITPGTYFGDTIGAANDAPISCGASESSPDVWYRFSAAASGAMRVDTCGSDYDSVLSIHTGCPANNGNQVACNDDACALSSIVEFTVEAGQDYLIRVSGWNGASGNFVLRLLELSAPTNDSCSGAEVITLGEYFGETVLATNDGSASCGASASSPDRWYRFTALSAGLLRIDTCGSDYDSVLSVHTDCPLNNGDELACNDDSCGLSSTVQVSVSVGVDYLIRVSGYNNAVGSYYLRLAMLPPPPNDTCANATQIADGAHAGYTLLADQDGVATCGNSASTPDVWYRYRSLGEGTLRINTCNSPFDTVVSVHSACPGDAQNQLACNDDGCGFASSLSLPATPGMDYLIRVSGSGGAVGSFTLNVLRTPTPVTGADVLVGELNVMEQYGRLGDTIGCAIDSPLCNAGDEPLDWYANPDPRHPFAVFNMYRLRNDQFEQIGMSWIKHGFGAAQENACNLGCIPHQNSTRLGIGCSDTYSAGLNGYQPGLGPRHEVNPFTGAYVFAGSHLDVNGSDNHNPIDHRLQIRDADLDPALNAGAVYFAEVYIPAHDDANHANSIAWEAVSVSGSPGGNWTFNIGGGATQVGPALNAWAGATRTVIPAVVAGDGQCHLAAKASDNLDGTWHYEYVLYNHDMDRGARRFALTVAAGVSLTNVAFHAVRSHGEPFSNTPWAFSRTGDEARWETAACCTPAANPLRWGTAYSFRFDASAAPVNTLVTITPYKPGASTAFHAPGIGPGPSLLGDMNCDGIVNAADAPAFALALLNAEEYATQYPQCPIERADMNASGVIDGGDLQAFVDVVGG